MGYEVDFLHVGDAGRSGDAVALRFGNLLVDPPQQAVIIIDGGFRETGEALIEHVRRYYHTDTVDLVVSTHPDADHTNGLYVVLEKLRVRQLLMHLPWNHARDIAELFRSGRVTDESLRRDLRESLDAACDLAKLAQHRGIPVLEPFAGCSGWNGALQILGPTREFYEFLLPQFRGTPAPLQRGVLARSWQTLVEVARSVAETWDKETLADDGDGGTTPENDSSAIVLLTWDGDSLLFTGDAGIPALAQAADRLDAFRFDYRTLRFIQVPHHGSKHNVGPTILSRLLGPIRTEDRALTTAFVSAATDGAPKHPSKKVTNAFRRRGSYVHATSGSTKRHHRDAPARDWTASTPLPFHTTVEE